MTSLAIGIMKLSRLKFFGFLLAASATVFLVVIFLAIAIYMRSLPPGEFLGSFLSYVDYFWKVINAYWLFITSFSLAMYYHLRRNKLNELTAGAKYFAFFSGVTLIFSLWISKAFI